MSKCLYCYKKLEPGSGSEFHRKCSREFFGTEIPPILPYSLKQMSRLAKEVVERSIAVPGVQPKLSLSLLSNSIRGKELLTVMGALGGNFILKPPSYIYPEMPQNEHVTMRMAEAFGLKTVWSSLIRLRSGELSYITRRVDRGKNGEKVHMLDMFQILGAVDKYKSSMERIGKAIEQHSDSTLLDQLAFFELCLFSFLTGNSDMHLKNFSMINQSGSWTLAPAYDLLNEVIANPADDEELALTLEGKKKKLKREHFFRFGRGLGLNEKQVNGAFGRLQQNRGNASAWLKSSFLSASQQKKYLRLIAERYKVLK
jgi:serine/threonine-protein kinase HipA